jgi:hypothetical protein
VTTMKRVIVVSLLIAAPIYSQDRSMRLFESHPSFVRGSDGSEVLSFKEGLHVNLIDIPPVTVGACVFDYHGARNKTCADHMTRSDCAQMERDMHGVNTTWYPR